MSKMGPKTEVIRARAGTSTYPVAASALGQKTAIPGARALLFSRQRGLQASHSPTKAYPRFLPRCPWPGRDQDGDQGEARNERAGKLDSG